MLSRSTGFLCLLVVVLTVITSAQRFTMITNNTTPDQYPRVCEDGSVCTWVNNGQAWVWDGGPSPRQITTGTSIPIPYYQTISGDGRSVGYVSNKAVWTVPVSGGTPVKAYDAASSGSVQGPLTLSHDGKFICFTKYDSSSRSSDQWVAKTDGSSAINVTKRNGTSYHDREGWMSADGTTVTYSVSLGGAREVWLVNADGSNPRKLTNFGTNDNIRFPVLDRFAKIVAFGRNISSSVYQIYTIPTIGGIPTGVSKPGVDSWMPYLSELDGDKVSFKTKELGTSEEVYMAYTDGKNRRQITTFQGGITRLTNSSHALNGDGTVGVYVTSQNWQNQNPSGDREIMLWHDALSRGGVVAPGKTVQLNLDVPGRPGDLYILRCAFNRSPGFLLPAVGTVPLNPDDLFILSGAVPSIFRNFGGVLDKNGMAFASIAIPNVPTLRGLRFYAAFVAANPQSLFISNSMSLTIL